MFSVHEDRTSLRGWAPKVTRGEHQRPSFWYFQDKVLLLAKCAWHKEAVNMLPPRTDLSKDDALGVYSIFLQYLFVYLFLSKVSIYLSIYPSIHMFDVITRTTTLEERGLPSSAAPLQACTRREQRSLGWLALQNSDCWGKWWSAWNK